MMLNKGWVFADTSREGMQFVTWMRRSPGQHSGTVALYSDGCAGPGEEYMLRVRGTVDRGLIRPNLVLAPLRCGVVSCSHLADILYHEFSFLDWFICDQPQPFSTTLSHHSRFIPVHTLQINSPTKKRKGKYILCWNRWLAHRLPPFVHSAGHSTFASLHTHRSIHQRKKRDSYAFEHSNSPEPQQSRSQLHRSAVILLRGRGAM